MQTADSEVSALGKSSLGHFLECLMSQLVSDVTFNRTVRPCL